MRKRVLSLLTLVAAVLGALTLTQSAHAAAPQIDERFARYEYVDTNGNGFEDREVISMPERVKPQAPCDRVGMKACFAQFNQGFTHSAYQTVICADPDVAGLAFHTRRLDLGQSSQEDVVASLIGDPRAGNLRAMSAYEFTNQVFINRFEGCYMGDSYYGPVLNRGLSEWAYARAEAIVRGELTRVEFILETIRHARTQEIGFYDFQFYMDAWRASYDLGRYTVVSTVPLTEPAPCQSSEEFEYGETGCYIDCDLSPVEGWCDESYVIIDHGDESYGGGL